MLTLLFKACKVVKRESELVAQSHVCAYVLFVVDDLKSGKGGAAVKGACNPVASSPCRLLENRFLSL